MKTIFPGAPENSYHQSSALPFQARPHAMMFAIDHPSAAQREDQAART